MKIGTKILHKRSLILSRATVVEYVSIFSQSVEPEERNLAMKLSALYIEKLQEAQQVGRQEGRTEEGQALILRQLTRRVGNVPIEAEIQVKALPLERLEELGEALLDFARIGDLLAWLDLESQ